MYTIPEWYVLLRYSHMVVGFVGLIVYWIPIFAKKGSVTHIRAGRVFEWCGYYVATTAIIGCARYLWIHSWKLLDRGISAEAVAESYYIQFFVALLAFLALLVLAALRSGVRVVRTRNSPNMYPNWEARTWLYLVPVVGLLLSGLSVIRLLATDGRASYYWISMIVGLIPLGDLKKELAFFRDPCATRMAWWFRHMDCMLGSGIAFHTAGLVFTTRWVATRYGLELSGPVQLIPWLMPALIGIPLSRRWLNHYRTKFHSTSKPKETISASVPEQTFS